MSFCSIDFREEKIFLFILDGIRYNRHILGLAFIFERTYDRHGKTPE